MRSNKRSQDRFPGMTSVNSYASVYFDAWQNYFDTLNEVWGDVTAPDAQFGAWTSGFSKLLQAWTDGAADVCGAYTSAHRDNDEHVVAFVVDRDAECTDPKTVSLPPGTQCPHVEWTDLRGTGGSGGPQIDRAFLHVTAQSGGRRISVALVNLESLGAELRRGMYLAIIYEGSAPNAVTPPPRRPLAIVVVTFV